MVCQEVRINNYEFRPMAIIVLFIVLLISFIFNFFFIVITLNCKKRSIGFRGKRKHLKIQKQLKNVGGKADSLPIPLLILIMFLYIVNQM